MKNAHLKTRNETHKAECEISTPQIVVLINRNSGHCGRRLELVCHAEHSLSFVDSAPTTVIGLVGIRYKDHRRFISPITIIHSRLVGLQAAHMLSIIIAGNERFGLTHVDVDGCFVVLHQRNK